MPDVLAAPPGMWSTAVAVRWLSGVGVPHDPRVKLRANEWPEGHDRAIRLTPAPGVAGGRSAGEEASRHTSWRSVQLMFRGRQRDDTGRDVEALALATHARVVAAPTGVYVPAGGGRVWIPREGVAWPPGGPSPMGPAPDGAERDLWTCTYLVRVIEYPIL